MPRIGVGAPPNLTLAETFDHLQGLANAHTRLQELPPERDLFEDCAPIAGAQMGHYKTGDAIWTIAGLPGREQAVLVSRFDRQTFSPEDHTRQLPIDVARLEKRDGFIAVSGNHTEVERRKADYAMPEFALTCRALSGRRVDLEGEPNDFVPTRPLREIFSLDLPEGFLTAAAQLDGKDRYVATAASEREVTAGSEGAWMLRELTTYLLRQTFPAVAPRDGYCCTSLSETLQVNGFGLGVKLRKETNFIISKAVQPPFEDERADSYPDSDYAIINTHPYNEHAFLITGTPHIVTRVPLVEGTAADSTPILFDAIHDAQLAGNVQILTDHEIDSYLERLRPYLKLRPPSGA